MKTQTRHSQHPTCALLILAAALGCTSALAATKSAQQGRAQYQRDIATCSSSKYVGDRSECLDDAHTAFIVTQPAALDDDPGIRARNALMRCEPLREPDRQDCVLRMQGKGTTSGSVAGGGIYRELLTREVGKPPVAAPEAVTPPVAPAPAVPAK